MIHNRTLSGEGKRRELLSLARTYKAIKGAYVIAEDEMLEAGFAVSAAMKVIDAYEATNREGTGGMYTKLESTLERHTFLQSRLASYAVAVKFWADKIADLAVTMLDG